jgi:hypothetical protein
MTPGTNYNTQGAPITIRLCKKGALLTENLLVNWRADINLRKLVNGLLVYQWITVEWH